MKASIKKQINHIASYVRNHAVRERFESKISVVFNGCWEWQATLEHNGYGKFSVRKNNKWSMEWAHRVSYLMYKGDIPQGLVIDHICRNRRCVNPEHLRAATPRENFFNSDSVASTAHTRRACKRGHVYTTENTTWYQGTRGCRDCWRLYSNNQRRACGQQPRKPKGLKSHCIHGHAYNAENTYTDPKGYQRCRVCVQAQQVQWRKDHARKH